MPSVELCKFFFRFHIIGSSFYTIIIESSLPLSLLHNKIICNTFKSGEEVLGTNYIRITFPFIPNILIKIIFHCPTAGWLAERRPPCLPQHITTPGVVVRRLSYKETTTVGNLWMKKNLREEEEEEELFVFVSALGSEEIVKIRNAPLCTCWICLTDCLNYPPLHSAMLC